MNLSGANPIAMGNINCRISVTPKLSRNQSKAVLERSNTLTAKPLPQIHKISTKLTASAGGKPIQSIRAIALAKSNFNNAQVTYGKQRASNSHGGSMV